MNLRVILFALLALHVTTAVVEKHYHYHGLNPEMMSMMDADHKLFGFGSKPHCYQLDKKWYHIGKNDGWNCSGAWDKCSKKCNAASANGKQKCTWTCTTVSEDPA